MKIVLDKGAYLPEKAHEYDAGYDLRTPARERMSAEQTVTEIMNEVKEKICDNYCKYVEDLRGEKEYHDLIRIYCNRCPLNRI